MANRFDKTYDQPWVSQYVPLPLKDIEAGYEKQQGRYDKAMELVTDLSTPITGGNRTKDQAADINAKKDAAIKAAVDKAAANNDYSKLQYEVKSIANQIKSNPIYQGIELDKQLSPLADKAIMEPDAQNHVQDYFDQDKKTYNQKPLDQPFTANDYQTIKPVDFYEDHKDLYTALHAQSVKEGGPVSGLKYEYNQNGELVGVNENHQQIRKGIAPEDVEAFAERWTSNPNNWKGRGSVVYRDAASKKKFGVGYDQSDYIQDMVNNYPGYYAETSDVTTQSNIPVKGAGKGKGVGKTEEFGDNRMDEIVRVAHEEGGAMLNSAEQAALIGGTSDEKHGTVEVNATGRNIYLNIGKTGSQEENEKSAIIGRAVPLFDKKNKIVEKSEDKIKDFVLNLPSSKPGQAVNDYVDPNGGVWHNPGGSLGKATYTPKGGKKIDVEDINGEFTNEFKSSKGYQGLISNQMEINGYSKLKEEADAEGIDLDDKTLKSDIDKNVGDSKSLGILNSMLSNIKGQLTYIPKAGKNLTGDDKGDMLLSGDAFVSDEQMKKIAPDNAWFSSEGYNKLEKDGLIYKTSIFKTNAKGEEVEIPGYAFSVTTPVVGQDVGNATRNITAGRAGGYHEWVSKVVPGQIEQVNDRLHSIKLEKTAKKFEEQYAKNPDKTITSFDLDYNHLISGKPVVGVDGKTMYPTKLSDQEKADLNSYKVSIMQDETMSKSEKAKELFKMKLLLTDINAYKKLYGGASLGKQQPQQAQMGQQIQDNSNPLGM